MGRIRLHADHLFLEIDHAAGASVTDLSIRGPDGEPCPILRRAPGVLEGPRAFLLSACYLMAPWVNRIDSARFRFAGREHRLRADWPDGTAIHGEVKDRAWEILDRSPVSARLGYDSRWFPGGPGAADGANWPWPFACEARFELGPGGVEFELSVINTGEEPFPAGAGWHPFFNRRLWDERDEVRVRVGASGRYPLERCLPTGPSRADEVSEALRAGGALGERDLDDVFGPLSSEDGSARIEWPASGVRAVVRCSPEVTHAVVFSPRSAVNPASSEPWFCLEPCTMATDAFNLDARNVPGVGVRVLAPGERLNARWTLSIER